MNYTIKCVLVYNGWKYQVILLNGITVYRGSTLYETYKTAEKAAKRTGATKIDK
jgi:hypothetical protein